MVLSGGYWVLPTSQCPSAVPLWGKKINLEEETGIQDWKGCVGWCYLLQVSASEALWELCSVGPSSSGGCAQLLSRVWRFCDPLDCSPPGSSVREMSRQENWSGLPFPPRGHLPNSGVKPASPTPPRLHCRRQMPCHWATGKALSPRLEAVQGFWPDYVTLGLSAWLGVWSWHCLLRDTLRTSQPLMRPAKAFLIPYRGIAAIKCWILLLICPLLALQCLEQCPTPCRQWINKYSPKQASQASLVVKNRLPMQETRETQVSSLGRENPPEDVCLQAG